MIAGIEVNLSLILNIIRTIIDLLLVWYILYLGISMFKQNMRTIFSRYGFDLGNYCGNCNLSTRNSFIT